MEDDLVKQTCARFNISPKFFGVVCYRLSETLMPHMTPVERVELMFSWTRVFCDLDTNTQQKLIAEVRAEQSVPY